MLTSQYNFMSEQLFFNTIEKPSYAEFKDRGSRFLAYAFPIQLANDFKKHQQQLKKEHPKAVHHCFAYRLGTDRNTFRVSDDGEPAGTAGKPILGQLDTRDIINTVVIVVRYFGGTLLGVPGLINAYKSAAAMALQLTPLVQKQVTIDYKLSFDYTRMNDVMMIIKQFGCEVKWQQVLLFCELLVSVPKARLDEVIFKFKELTSIEATKL
jgi:uncharacterized YigZ family protein